MNKSIQARLYQQQQLLNVVAKVNSRIQIVDIRYGLSKANLDPAEAVWTKSLL